ncbi:equilibrative nucleoside transporter 1-like [Anastrepha ludens]|uniref:equilibrative nucleoside transporter 1-like n=1 Tax=Anastrepha ludens TaxID=28586 RepID=UPI0023B00F6C|nr:equilibrative nucleoside transporter 1-like [Anastrepha ludens]XP_053969980.1 equilibrative nucleoside transporter 1-like [Anastrepha ludens]
MEPPKDKWNFVLLIFVVHGIGTLMPWNMFITAKSYFVDYKLSDNTNSTSSTTYASNFLQYHNFAAQIPNVVFNWLNIFVNLGGDLTKRIVFSILLELALFILTVILAMVDSSNWPGVFFWTTMVTVVLLNMAGGVYQNTIYGMVATHPFKYTGAVVLGSNICGLFVSILSIVSNSIFTSKRTAAIYYFITAMVVLLACFDTFFALPLNKFYRYNQLSRNSVDEEKKFKGSSVPYWAIFKKISLQLYNVFCTFFVTLAIFPSVHSDIKASSNNFIIQDPGLFTSVTCFLTFNLFAMLGSLTTSWVQWPGPKYLFVPVTLRIVFIPLFLYCNYLPLNVDRKLPVLISNEWAYWLIAIIMSWSSGYLSSLAMMYAPEKVEPKYQVKAGMFAAAMLITGIFAGILFSFLNPYLVA